MPHAQPASADVLMADRLAKALFDVMQAPLSGASTVDAAFRANQVMRDYEAMRGTSLAGTQEA